MPLILQETNANLALFSFYSSKHQSYSYHIALIKKLISKYLPNLGIETSFMIPYLR